MNRLYRALIAKLWNTANRIFVRLNEWAGSKALKTAGRILLLGPLKAIIITAVTAVMMLITFSQVLLNIALFILTAALESFVLSSLMLLFIERFKPLELISLYETLFFGSDAARELIKEFQSYQSFLDAFQLGVILVLCLRAAQILKRIW